MESEFAKHRCARARTCAAAWERGAPLAARARCVLLCARCRAIAEEQAAAARRAVDSLSGRAKSAEASRDDERAAKEALLAELATTRETLASEREATAAATDAAEVRARLHPHSRGRVLRAFGGRRLAAVRVARARGGGGLRRAIPLRGGWGRRRLHFAALWENLSADWIGQSARACVQREH